MSKTYVDGTFAQMVEGNPCWFVVETACDALLESCSAWAKSFELDMVIIFTMYLLDNLHWSRLFTFPTTMRLVEVWGVGSILFRRYVRLGD